MKQTNKKRYFAKIQGVVQGVGFRPYVYNQANLFNIKGWVSNEGSALVIDIEGYNEDIKHFLIKIVKYPPSLANIERVEITSKVHLGYQDFSIRTSSSGENDAKFIAADVAICVECLNDIFDSSNFRYQYPFTNCTNCGPRYSIIKSLPYDRINTTMNPFEMCSICEKEYNAPTNRRFHAQPNCCPNCGPSYKLLTSNAREVSTVNPIESTISLIKQGKIVAIKGLGGFHLVCNAQDKQVVGLLRDRKRRPHKPFAVMVKDIDIAKNLCFINDEEEKALLSNKRPIVILKKKDTNILPNIINPNTDKIGIMLPYMPLHYMLFEGDISFLVMTSGNISGGSIEYKNDEAIERLSSIADFFLVHNREINIPVEDSVVKVIKNKEIVIRRARGYTPYTIKMNTNRDIMALGAEQKNTFCLSQNRYIYLSQYLGDLKDLDAYNTYTKAIENLMKLTDFTPNLLACDLDSRLMNSQFLKYNTIKKIAVQHHHAHMVSCMVEHNLYAPVIGVIYDGTGLGADGNIWGGEFLIGTREKFTRVGHLKYISIQGGDKSIKEPWRIALSYLNSINFDVKKILKSIDEYEINTVKQALDKNINCYKSSSMGRFFDCIASILNICHKITYDAQAAIELENILKPSIQEYYNFCIEEQGGMFEINYDTIIFEILKDIDKGIPNSIISTKFHNSIGILTIDLICKISERYGIKQVVLSGGVFENNYLLSYILDKLNNINFEVYFNQQIPTNDSGISVGQLAIADASEGKM